MTGAHIPQIALGSAGEATSLDDAKFSALAARLEQTRRCLANSEMRAGIGSWSYDVATESFFLSDGFYRIAGYEPGGFEPTWERCLGIVHVEDRERLSAVDPLPTAASGPAVVEVRMIRPNGEIRHVESRFQASLGTDGAPAWIHGTILDITDRKDAAAAMYKVLTGANCLSWQASVEEIEGELLWELEFIDEAATKKFLPLDVPRGRTYVQCLNAGRHPDDAERMDRLSADSIRSGSSGYQQEFRVRSSNGSYRWLAETASIEPVGDKRWRLTGVCTDVTSSKQAQDQMSQVLQNARCLLWQANVRDVDGLLDWEVVYSNPDAAQKFMPVTILPGLTYTHAFDAARLRDLDPPLFGRYTSEMPAGKGGYQQEFRVRIATGEVRWLSENVTIEPAEPGLWRLTGVATDITDRKNAEVEMTQLLASARCLLWQADVSDVDGENLWDLKFRNPESAHQFLPVSIPAGGTFTDGFFEGRPEEYRDAVERQSFTAIRRGHKGYRQEFPIRVATGELRWMFEDVHIDASGPGKWRLTGVCTDVTDLKRAQEETAQVLSSARCLLWRADVTEKNGELSWETEYRNPEAAQQFFPLDTSGGVSYAEAMHLARLPGQATDHRSRNAILSGQKGYQQEFSVRASNGELKWLSEDVHIEPRGNGHWRVTGVSIDITERKAAEEALRRSEANYQGIVANVPGVVAQLLQREHGSFECLYVNAAAIHLLGREPDELMRNPELLFETIHPDDRPRFRNAFKEGAQTLAPWKWEGWCSQPSGDVIWIEVSVRAELQANRDILWDLLLMDATPRKNMEATLQRSREELESRFHDRTTELRRANAALQSEIAERKLAQDELRDSEARYRAIVEDQTDMICRFLADGTRLFVNEAYCRYYGVRPEAVLGTSFLTHMSAKEAAETRAYLDLLGPHNPVGTHEVSFCTTQGEVRWQKWTDRYISNDAGDFVCFQSVGHDITVRRQAEEALILAKEEAERANLAKSEFLSRMSHELRTPLNAILGFGQLLDRSGLGPSQMESVSHILMGGRHLLGLINEILDLSRVESGRIDVSIEPVSLAEVVQESLDLVRSMSRDYEISLSSATEGLGTCHALADRQRLKQVVINLLSNAIKYNRPGGSVAVSCDCTANRARISVSDTGIGIHPGDLGKLFTPFERLAADNSAVEGTGLGLALSKRLVELMNGRVDVQSVPGVGSKFTVELPAAPSPQEALSICLKANPKHESQTTTGRSFSLLYIEDNPSNLRLVEVILKSRPELTLASAVDGRKGIDLAIRLRPDLILLDLNLPDMNGFEVVTRLRQSESTRGIPVIVISADATPVRIEQLLTIGAQAYLPKPLDVVEFLSKVDHFLGQ
jgi:PAS domain S-box-containing protein